MDEPWVTVIGDDHRHVHPEGLSYSRCGIQCGCSVSSCSRMRARAVRSLGAHGAEYASLTAAAALETVQLKALR